MLKKKKKKKGGGEGDIETLIGFAWLDWWLKHILNGATIVNEFGEREAVSWLLQVHELLGAYFQ